MILDLVRFEAVRSAVVAVVRFKALEVEGLRFKAVIIEVVRPQVNQDIEFLEAFSQHGDL